MPLISHRGAAHLATANSFEAVIKGDSYSPAYVEVDINCTADDILVIYHGSVRRFLQGKKTKETFDELKAKYPYLMSLEEFVKKSISSAYMFDVKIQDDASLEMTAKLLKRLGRDDFSFTSPHEKSLVEMKKAFPKAVIFQSQPYHHGPITALEIARKHNFEGIALNKWWLTPLVYHLCKIHGKKVDAYTIDSWWAIWLSQKVFPGAYITTNRPDIYRKFFPTE